MTKEKPLSEKVIRNHVDLKRYKDPYYLDVKDVKEAVERLKALIEHMKIKTLKGLKELEPDQQHLLLRRYA